MAQRGAVCRHTLVTAAIIVGLWGLRRLLLRTALRRFGDAATRYHRRRSSLYITVTVGLALIAVTWLGGLRDMAIHVGLIAAPRHSSQIWRRLESNPTTRRLASAADQRNRQESSP